MNKRTQFGLTIGFSCLLFAVKVQAQQVVLPTPPPICVEPALRGESSTYASSRTEYLQKPEQLGKLGNTEAYAPNGTEHYLTQQQPALDAIALMTEKIKRLTEENDHLRQEIAELKAKIPSQITPDKSPAQTSGGK